MATVDWALVCDLAYFDRNDRLCIFGAETGSQVPTVPVGTRRVTLVVRLLDVPPGDPLDPGLMVTSPAGEWRGASDVRDFCVEARDGCVIVHLPSVEFLDEGLYRFELALGTAEPAILELSLCARRRAPNPVHLHGAH